MRRILSRCWIAYIFFVALCPDYSLATDFSQCLADVMSCANSPTGDNCVLNISNATALSVLRTSDGLPITDASQLNSTEPATGISFAGCVKYCGKGPAISSWNTIFSQEFSAWLLPYLALLSQLPFGSQRRIDNLMSVSLTLGSPALAAYSLYITLLNTRWLNDRLFSGIDYPSAAVRRAVVQVLSDLQQVPLRIHPGGSGQFESLVIHPSNDQWWITISKELNYSHTWSIASAASIAWVVIAYLLTVADSFSDLNEQNDSNGQGSVSIWIWLVPIVVGWLVISPRCDYDRVRKAYDKANRHVFVPDLHDPSADPVPVTHNFGLTINPSPDWKYADRNLASPDESRIPPVFNYARVLSWSQTVYLASLSYRIAWRKWNHQEGFDGQFIRNHVHGDVPSECRLGTRDQITRYCHPNDHACTIDNTNVLWPRGVFSNIVIASFMSLQLQWATTGAAVIAAWYTPTTGLGCRSLAFLIYGAISTIVWMLLVSSSALGYHAHHLINGSPTSRWEKVVRRSAETTTFTTQAPTSTAARSNSPNVATPALDTISFDEMEEGAVTDTKAHSRNARVLYRIADWLRWTGKLLAIINSIIIIANSILQYTGVYDNCYCDSSVFSRGSSAFRTLVYSPHDISLATSAWIGALAIAWVSCAFFVGTIYLLRDSLLD